MNQSSGNLFTVVNGERCYIGQERRIDRRRTNNNRRLENLLNNFGLDRRIRQERRKANTSWLLMAKAANL